MRSTQAHILQIAQEEALAALDVLPLLGFPTYDYNLFIYQEIWLKNKASLNKVLSALKEKTETDLYDLAMVIHAEDPQLSLESKERLLARRMPFLQEYLSHYLEHN